MTRALGIALVATLGVGAVACGNIARDVIVERAALDGGALDAEAETGAVSSPPPDAGTPKPPPGKCLHDAGCLVVHRCEPGECSELCSLGCTGSNDSHKPRRRSMMWHASPP